MAFTLRAMAPRASMLSSMGATFAVKRPVEPAGPERYAVSVPWTAKAEPCRLPRRVAHMPLAKPFSLSAMFRRKVFADAWIISLKTSRVGVRSGSSMRKVGSGAPARGALVSSSFSSPLAFWASSFAVHVLRSVASTIQPATSILSTSTNAWMASVPSKPTMLNMNRVVLVSETTLTGQMLSPMRRCWFVPASTAISVSITMTQGKPME
mmetsp:Transcript_45562/g.132023  ORF Transcript_45562/g.132023 Transcript_45562/m.132023 type:complete len:209 (+) Transcript_45562:920-1546(+)